MMESICPNCQASVRAHARYCSICGQAVTLPDELSLHSYRSVLQETTYLAPEWQQEVNVAMARSGDYLPLPPETGPVGERREPLLVMLLPIVSLGLYAFYWWWKAGREIRGFLHGGEPLPVRDITLLIITGGLWRFVMHYNYAARIVEMQERSQLPRTEYLKFVCPALSFFLLGFVSLALMQQELNKIWDAHQYGPR